PLFHIPLLHTFPTRRSSDLLPFAINLKFFSTGNEYALVPPEIFKQVPYYYYQTTGNLVLMDSIIKKNQYYFSYPPYLPDTTLPIDRKSTRLNSSHVKISYAV